jgi:Tol biopolymer transport system component
VTELLEGATLRDRLAAGPLPSRKALDCAAQIARGLAAAHDKGIVHRDLKPENLFVTRDGRVKILDFGLAKALGGEGVGEGSTLAETEPGAVLGTAGYMAPEQVRGKPADARSDIFAFGAVLYEMLAGRRAFEGDTAIDRAHAILNKEPLPLPADVPPAVQRVVQRCLEKAPDERFGSARDLGFALEALSDASGIAADAVKGPARHRVSPMLALALGAVACAATFVAGSMFRRPRPIPTSAAGVGEPGRAAPRLQQLTFRRGTIHEARFAPDGKTVIYSAAWKGAPAQIFQTIPGNPESRPILPPGYDLLAVSRNGELAVLADGRRDLLELSIGTLALTHLGGGEPRKVTENVIAADFLPDGSLAIARWVPDPRADFGGRTQLEIPVGKVVYQSKGWITNVRVSPRGDEIAFVDPAQLSFWGTWLVVADRHGAMRRLGARWLGIGGLAWSADGSELWVNAIDEQSASAGLHVVSRQGEARFVYQAPSDISVRDISPSGRVLVASGELVGSLRGHSPGASAERDLTIFGLEWARAITPDGASVLVSEYTGVGGAAGYLLRTDGSSSVRVGQGDPTDLTRDGKWVLEYDFPAMRRLQVVPTGPGEPRPLPAGPITKYLRAWWFPDGRRILALAYAGDALRVWIQDAAGTEPRPFGDALVWRDDPPISPDGKWVLVLGPKGERLLQEVDGPGMRPLPGLEPRDWIGGWSADGRVLYVRRGAHWVLPARLEKYDIATGRFTPWRTFMPEDQAGDLNLSWFQVSPDGRAYVYTQERVVSQLHLLTW